MKSISHQSKGPHPEADECEPYVQEQQIISV